MSHRWDCPTRREVERRAERDFEYGGRRYSAPSDYSGCDDAERRYRDHMSSLERQAEERAFELRRERHRQEEAMCERQMEQQYLEAQAYEAAMAEAMEAEYLEEMARQEASHYDAMERECVLENLEPMRWEDDGGASAGGDSERKS